MGVQISRQRDSHGPDRLRYRSRILLRSLTRGRQLGPHLRNDVEHPAGSRPSPQAVDAQGNVYVYNKGFNSVSRYDPAGNPVNFSALGTNTIDGQGGNNCPSVPSDCDRVPVGGLYAEEGYYAHVPTVAVDATDGPTAGYIYVENAGTGDGTSDTANAQVEVFAPTGAFLGEINTNSDSPGHISHRPGSVNVDQHGNVYVRAQAVLDKFVPIDGNPAHDVYGGQVRARILLYGQSNEYTMAPIDGAGEILSPLGLCPAAIRRAIRMGRSMPTSRISSTPSTGKTQRDI